MAGHTAPVRIDKGVALSALNFLSLIITPDP